MILVTAEIALELSENKSQPQAIKLNYLVLYMTYVP